MLKAGYTSVGEFHYLHHDPKGEPYADPGELARRIVTAAARAEIRLTLLPVFYAHADFGGKPPAAGQKRFVHTPESYCRLVAKLERDAARSGYTLGVAPHSLRAVMPEELTQVVARVSISLLLLLLLTLPLIPLTVYVSTSTLPTGIV